MGSKELDEKFEAMFNKFQTLLDSKLDDVKNDIKKEITNEIQLLKEDNLKVQSAVREWTTKLDRVKDDLKKEISDVLRADLGVQRATLKEELALDLTGMLATKNESEILQLQASDSQLKDEINALKTSMATQNEKITKLESTCATLYKELELVDQPTIDQVEDLNRYTRKCNLDIHGIPENPGEDPFELVCDIATVLQIRCSPGDLVAAHSIPTKRVNSPKPIIVRFDCHWKKEIIKTWKRRSRTKNIPTTEDVGLRSGPAHNIYINEQLTALNKGLHKRARDLRSYGLKFVWTSDGKVLVRESESSPVIHIKKTEDIVKLEKKLK